MKNELYHHGILGQKWGVRRFQNKDGSLTNAGKRRYLKEAMGKLISLGPATRPTQNSRSDTELGQDLLSQQSNRMDIRSQRPRSRQKYVTNDGSGVHVRKDKSVSSNKGFVSDLISGLSYDYKKALTPSLPSGYSSTIHLHNELANPNVTSDGVGAGDPTEGTLDDIGLTVDDLVILDEIGVVDAYDHDIAKQVARIVAIANAHGLDKLTIDTDGYIPGAPYSIFKELRNDPTFMLFPAVQDQAALHAKLDTLPKPTIEPPKTDTNPGPMIKIKDMGDLMRGDSRDFYGKIEKATKGEAPVKKKKPVSNIAKTPIDKAKEFTDKFVGEYQDNFNVGMDSIMSFFKKRS